MKALVTTLGRSHFIQVATSLVRADVDVTLFQGWVVKNPRKSWLLRLASKIIGRESLIYGFERRTTPELNGRIVGDFTSEFVETLGKRTTSWMGRRVWNFWGKVGFALHGFRARRLLKHRHFDIFHVRSGFGAGGGIEAARRIGTKVLVDHSAGAPQFVIEKVYNRPWGPWTFWWTVMQDCQKADLLMVDCDWVKQTFLMYGYPEEKIRVVYMGLDSKFNGMKKWNEGLSGIGQTPENPLRVVFTGGFAYHKGNEYFLGAVEKLLDSRKYFAFTAIGDTSISDEQRAKYARALEVINFKGHLPQDEMCRNMLDSQVYLFPSLSEGCAKSAYEAMSMGLCVACTKETGLPLEHGLNGYIVETRDANSIAARLLWFIEHPDEMRRAGLAGTEEMRKHTWERYAEEVKAVYRELMEL